MNIFRKIQQQIVNAGITIGAAVTCTCLGVSSSQVEKDLLKPMFIEGEIILHGVFFLGMICIALNCLQQSQMMPVLLRCGNRRQWWNCLMKKLFGWGIGYSGIVFGGWTILIVWRYSKYLDLRDVIYLLMMFLTLTGVCLLYGIAAISMQLFLVKNQVMTVLGVLIMGLIPTMINFCIPHCKIALADYILGTYAWQGEKYQFYLNEIGMILAFAVSIGAVKIAEQKIRTYEFIGLRKE